jgi:hypothetical protein
VLLFVVGLAREFSFAHSLPSRMNVYGSGLFQGLGMVIYLLINFDTLYFI